MAADGYAPLYRAGRWIFRTPDWIRNEPGCLEKLRVLRVIEAFSVMLTAAYVIAAFVV